MKNITKLLLTSALVAGVASSAYADAPVVKVGGKVDFRAGIVNQKSAYKTDTATDTTSSNAYKSGRAKMATTARVGVNAEGKTDAGLTYGAVVELEDTSFYNSNDEGDKDAGQFSSGDDGDAVRVRKSFVYFDSAMGRVELGSGDAASKTLAVDASNIARASGGIDGDATAFINEKVGYIPLADLDSGTNYAASQYLTSPDLLADVSSSARKYNKVSYYTPDVSGLKLGLSYATDNESRGGLKGITGKDFGAQLKRSSDVGYTDVFSAGLTYNYAMDNVALQLGATGQYGKAKKMNSVNTGYTSARNNYHNLRAYKVGAVVTYTNFSLAGSYGDNGKSGLTKEATNVNYFNKGSKFYTAGASYVQGPVGLSVTNFSSKRMRNKFDLLSVGADYELAKGALAYVEANMFKYTDRKSVV